MRVAEARLQTAGEWLVGEQRVEIDRRLGNVDAMALNCSCGTWPIRISSSSMPAT
jgi:hypothetical protein